MDVCSLQMKFGFLRKVDVRDILRVHRLHQNDRELSVDSQLGWRLDYVLVVVCRYFGSSSFFRLKFIDQFIFFISFLWRSNWLVLFRSNNNKLFTILAIVNR